MFKTVTKISVARLVTGVYNLVGKCFLVSKCSGFNSPPPRGSQFFSNENIRGNSLSVHHFKRVSRLSM